MRSMSGWIWPGSLLLSGCLIDNPDFRCPSYPPGGGGGKGRPEALVKGGSFIMQGVPVMVTDFCLDVYEVTVRAYRDCFANGQCTKPGTTGKCNWSDAAAGKEDHPINCITWEQADAFCRWEGRRLPTEMEWEYAAGGAQKANYPWGKEDPLKEDSPARLCWSQTTGNGTTGTCPVGTYPKTLLGVLTMRDRLSQRRENLLSGHSVPDRSHNPPVEMV